MPLSQDAAVINGSHWTNMEPMVAMETDLARSERVRDGERDGEGERGVERGGETHLPHQLEHLIQQKD